MTRTQIANLALSFLGGQSITDLDADMRHEAIILRKWFDSARDEALGSHPWNFASKRVRVALSWTGITNVTSNGGIIRITASGHGLSTGDRVQIKDVQGVTNANGAWYVTVSSSSVFDLDGSIFSGVWTSSTGSFVKAPSFGWSYQFPLPADCLRVHRVNGLESNEEDSREYAIEGSYLLTSCDKLELLYVASITDTTTWTPQFINAFTLLLASYTAQSIVGPAGKQAELRQQYEVMIGPKAKGQDSRQGKKRAPVGDYGSDVLRARRGFWPR